MLIPFAYMSLGQIHVLWQVFPAGSDPRMVSQLDY